MATVGHAQTQEQLDAARAYMNTPVQQKLMEDMLSPEVLMAQMDPTGNLIPSDKKEIIATIISEEMLAMRPVMMESIVQGMATSFTLEEITALTEFYSSPLGASAMSKMAPFMHETMTAIGPEIQQMQLNVVKRIQAELRP